jgi:tetratricopeptide (TPR) repeat protein
VLTGDQELHPRLFERIPEGAEQPWVLEARAIHAGTGDDPGARVALAEAAAERFEAAGDLRNACLQRVSVGYALCEIGAWTRAERSLEDALAVGQRMALDNAVSIARAQIGRAMARRGDLDGARATLSRAIDALHAQKNTRLEGVARAYLASALLELGDADAAEKEADRAVDVLGAVPPMRCVALAVKAEVLLARGRAAEALALARAAREALDAGAKAATGETRVRIVLAEALEANGMNEAAHLSREEAKQRLMLRASRIADPELRAAFLAMPESQRTAR